MDAFSSRLIYIGQLTLHSTHRSPQVSSLPGRRPKVGVRSRKANRYKTLQKNYMVGDTLLQSGRQRIRRSMPCACTGPEIRSEVLSQ